MLEFCCILLDLGKYIIDLMQIYDTKYVAQLYSETLELLKLVFPTQFNFVPG